MFYKILKTIFDCVMFVILLAIVSSVLPINLPLKSYVVVSGSMEPVIKTGSLVFSQSFDKHDIKVGDIIAFFSPKNKQTIIVHRVNTISSSGEISTKGDNNNSTDDWQINKNNIIGKTFLTIPKAGQFFNLVRTPFGYILIIVLPALIFIILQSLTIRSALLEIENKKNTNIFLLFFVPLLLIFPPKVHALFIDTVQVSGVKLTVGDFSQQLPSSEITSVDIENQKIKINYTASSPDFSDIKVCYSYNLNQWQCFLSDKSATFVPPKGDGIYFFNTLIGQYGQFENKDYTQNYLSFQVDQVAPTSSLNIDKSFDNLPFYMGQPILGFSPVSLNPNNLSNSFDFTLPQKLSSILYFNYSGTSSDTCDFSNLTVSLNGQSLLQTGPQELGLGNWIDSNDSESFFYQLPIFSLDQTLNLSFKLSPESSSDTSFTISNIGIYPISLQIGNTFTPVITSHDIGSGVGETSVSITNSEIIFSSKDLLSNQENNQSADFIILPSIVLNEIKLGSVYLYKNTNTDIDLTGYFIANLSGETHPVTSLHNDVSPDFLNTGNITLNNSTGTIIDSFYFRPLEDNQVYWRRKPNGIGTWTSFDSNNGKISVSLITNPNANKILMTISNISDSFGQDTNDYLDYTIEYKSGSEQKQIYGKIENKSIVDNKTDREFYLGTCSTNNNCLPENISIGETIFLTVQGQSSGQIIDKNIWQVPF